MDSIAEEHEKKLISTLRYVYFTGQGSVVNEESDGSIVGTIDTHTE